MKSHRTGDGERTLAVFIDFENLALGFGNRRDRFSIEKVLERLVEKGKIVSKKAYADWSRFGNYASALHAAAVELVEIPKRTQTGKNSADIRMCVDAMDLAYSKDHIDTFVVVSGDSDFSPLVSKLKELGKHVIGLGLAEATSNLLRDNCDEFIYYEDLDRVPAAPLVANAEIPELKQKAFALVMDALHALRRENKEIIYSSMVKDTIKRKKPSFNEEYHGYRTFSDLLEDAQRFGLLELDKHKTSGTYMVTRFGGEARMAVPPVRPPVRVVELPAPVRPALPPVRPPALPPARPPEERGRRRPVEPPPPVVRPALPPEPPPHEPEDRVPLGRALIDEVDDVEDEVPSYRPRKVAAKPAAASGRRAAEKPAARPVKEEKPPATRAPRTATKPASRSGPASGKIARPPELQAEAPPAAPTRSGPPSGKIARPPELQPEPPVERSRSGPPSGKIARPPELQAPPKPAAKPAPKPVDDDSDFGAGLDL